MADTVVEDEARIREHEAEKPELTGKEIEMGGTEWAWGASQAGSQAR